MSAKSQKPPAYIAAHIRTVLKNGGSAPHTEEVQRFFKQEVQSRGWYTAELRKVAKRFRRTILAEQGLPYLLLVADQLFRGGVLEEKAFAVMLLEGMTKQFGRDEFKLFEIWLDRVSTWADHDALVHYLIGPMIALDDAYLLRLPRWAKKKSVWHQRAAAVGLIHSTRQHKNFEHIQRITDMLLPSDDDMVRRAWVGCCARRPKPSRTNSRLPYHHPRSRPAPRPSHGLRDAACRHASDCARESKNFSRGFTPINTDQIQTRREIIRVIRGKSAADLL
jgi:3-methyladenine DNA glycosylase AlkD